MPLLPTVSRLFRGALRVQTGQVAYLRTKPAKENLSVGEQAIAMTVMFITILGPSGWILSHLEDYKKK